MTDRSAGRMLLAVTHLKMARDFLEEGNAPIKAREHTRKALKSAESAQRALAQRSKLERKKP